MSAERLRQAANVLRERAEAVNAQIDSGHCYWGGNRDNYVSGVVDGLGGPAGDLAGTMSLPVALALADWLDVTAVWEVSPLERLFFMASSSPKDDLDIRAAAVADAILGGVA